MEYRVLGRTGLVVSRLCFGALTIGPLQASLPLKEGAAVIRHALEQGINFIDTAELYETYPYIRLAVGKEFKERVIIATKSYAYTAAMMEKSLQTALTELNRDYIDIFLLHEQESEHTLAGHREALEYLLRAKERGLVRAVGISTHTVAGVRAFLLYPELDVLHPMVNMAGIGIKDGTLADMLALLRRVKEGGAGIYGMKPLGGGHLIRRWREAMEFVLGLPELDAVAVGMKSRAEVDLNVALVEGRKIDPGLKAEVAAAERRLQVEDWCCGCGRCVEKCPQGALRVEEGRARVTAEKCVLCGYCGSACPEFCIKII